MSASEEINAKLDWLVEAVKYLLAQHVEDNVDAWLEEDAEQFEFRHRDEAPLPDLPPSMRTVAQDGPDPNEHIAVRTRPQPKAKACPHNRQGVDDAGNLICQRCGYKFTSTGSVQNRVGANGGIVRDPNPPEWALQHSPGASSKNPGTPLVPYSD